MVSLFEKDLGIRIIGLYLDNYLDLFSINEIASKLGKKYPYVHKRAMELIQEQYLNSVTVGRSTMCSLNLENPFVRYILGYFHLKRADNFEIDMTGVEFVVGRGKGKVEHIYVVGKGKSQNHITYLTEQQFMDELKDGLMHRHIVLKGHERFFEFIRKNKGELAMQFNPLMGQLQ
ncbi:MAG: hypothetical protein R6V53_06820 [Candidatus Woesearchaeota archaeon]